MPTKPFCEPIRVNSDFENEDGEITERATEASEAETEAVTTLADGEKKRVSGLSETELNRRFGAKLTTLLSKVPAKVSVTELSKGFVADEDAEPMFPQSRKPSVTPEFLSSSEMSGAERGTAVHRFVSLLDLKADPSDEIARLVSEGVLSSTRGKGVYLNRNAARNKCVGIVTMNYCEPGVSYAAAYTGYIAPAAEMLKAAGYRLRKLDRDDLKGDPAEVRRLLEERVSAVEGVRVTRLADGRAEVKCDVLFPAGYTAEDILRTLKGMPAIRSVEMHHPG